MHYYISAIYDLKVGEEDELMERATEERPLVFYSGLGMMLDKFEEKLLALESGESFDFTIMHQDAYGEYDDNGLVELPKEVFSVDGKIDGKILFEGNVVPLQDSEGNRVDASIAKIGHDTVTVDLNHPLAGEDLHFVGKILEKREASQEEIDKLHKGCGGGCHGGCCGNCDC